MRLSRIFLDMPLAPGPHDLPDAQAHYLSRVLRLQPGDPVQCFNGSGLEYPGILLEVSKRAVQVNLQEGRPGLPESPLAIHLGQCLSRGERMDWAIQKATELGATDITPLFSERCEVRLKDERSDKRLHHWRQIAISACEQCGRSVLPDIHAPQPLNHWVRQIHADLKLLLHPVATPLLQQPKPQSLVLLIGPEGGLSDPEINLARENGFQSARLGPRVLRTETAPVVALSVAQQLWGDLQAET